MKPVTRASFITSIGERCKACNACVRECPARAIRMRDGRAEVVAERCIACGNCVRACTQHAHVLRDATGEVSALLEGDAPVAALLDPAFPASFLGMEAPHLVGMLRALGFAYVNEAAFGAELVAERYRMLLASHNEKQWITSSCPAVVTYVHRFHPALTDSLVPLVSPMVAAARTLRAIHGPKLRIAYFGPCIARKTEAGSPRLKGEIDAASTFLDLRMLWAKRHLSPRRVGASDFDPPQASFGGIAALSRGLLQLAGIEEDFTKGDVVVACGRERFTAALKDFEAGRIDVRVLDLLACRGCIMGAAMTTNAPLFQRRYCLGRYVQAAAERGDAERWERNVTHFSGLNLTRTYRPDDQRVAPPSAEELGVILNQIGKHAPADELNCGACGYATCRELAAAIHMGLAEYPMCLPHAVEELRKTVSGLAESHAELSQVRAALAHGHQSGNTEPFAAGLAHELNNPLSVILMYINLLLEEGAAGPKAVESLTQAAEQVNHCRRIVGDLLHFARDHTLNCREAILRELVETAIELSWIPAKVEVRIEDGQSVAAEVDVDQMVELLCVLIGNACDAMPDGGVIFIRIAGTPGDGVYLSVSDTGGGISPEHLKRVFEPFFSTKEHARASGLGLANAQRIVRAHGGEIGIENEEGRGCTVWVRIPTK